MARTIFSPIWENVVRFDVRPRCTRGEPLTYAEWADILFPMTRSDYMAFSDDELFALAADAARSTAALAELYRRYARVVLPMLYARLPRDEVGDVNQELWLRIHRDLVRVAGRMKNFRAWLFRIASNLVTDRFRLNQAARIPADYDAADTRQADPGEGLLEKERCEVLSRCLERLGVDFREVIRAALDGEPTAVISQRLGISLDLVHQRKSRALKNLQECVESRLS